ncbi:MAG TPA: type III secretion system outer membrane ring subunit SctC [Steroidobacteraceae bacterium]|nr:type III secretion system outer membrane ring subunit SctC [Steroidobacteraceae bacterium]
MKTFLRRFRWIGCTVLLAWSASTCLAAEPWPAAPFKYYAHQSSLVRVLSDFSSTFGIALSLNPQVDGKVTGDFSARTPTEFLNALASSYGFNWYCQAGVLNISPAREWATDVLHVGMMASDVSALKTQLTELGIFEPRFGWAEFPGRGIVIVSGPDSYVGNISSIVGKLGTGPSDGRQLRVFKLQNARAEDYTFAYQGQHIVTPGVATLLRNLAAGSEAQQSQNPSTGPLSVAPADVAATQLATSATTTSLPSQSPLPQVDAKSASGGKVAVTAGLNALSPVIESDPRLNSVIVYDAPEKMPIYEALIHELDASRPQIQIEAMIVDVATDKIDSLGVAWRAGVGSVSAGFNGGGDGSGTILSVNTDAFFARVHALVTEGNARVLGRPSVLTLDNLSAVLSLSETVYARVSNGQGGKGGSYGSLMPITTGTTLKVVPRFVDENGRRDVAMAIEIQDGQIERDTDSGQDAPPTVRESSINTQAVVREKDCLLIGGYFTETDTRVERSVPGLGRIPVLGALFRDKTGEHRRSARLFVIRPTLVASSSSLSASLDSATR